MVTTIIDIDSARDVKWDIINNSDVIVLNDNLKNKILAVSDNNLLRVVKTIGSFKKIIEADVVDEAFLSTNILKN